MACSCGDSCERGLRHSDQPYVSPVSAENEGNWPCITTDRDSACDSSSETGMMEVEVSAPLLE